MSHVMYGRGKRTISCSWGRKGQGFPENLKVWNPGVASEAPTTFAEWMSQPSAATEQGRVGMAFANPEP